MTEEAERKKKIGGSEGEMREQGKGKINSRRIRSEMAPEQSTLQCRMRVVNLT